MKTLPSMKVTLLAFLLVMAAGVQGVLAQNRGQERVSAHPGFVNFDTVSGWFAQEPKLLVNVQGSLLRMVVSATRQEDPELASMLSRLQAVQVRGYSLGTGRPGVERNISDFARQLESRGWEAVVRVREPDQRVDMFIQTRNDNIMGLMVMVVEHDSDEAIFVNIVGEVDPDQIGRIGKQFNVRQLEGVSIQSNRSRNRR
jgi:hypothetical protein